MLVKNYNRRKFYRQMTFAAVLLATYWLVSSLLSFFNPYWHTLNYPDGQVTYRANFEPEVVTRLDRFFRSTHAYRYHRIQRIGFERERYHVGLILSEKPGAQDDRLDEGMRLGRCMAYAVFNEAIEVHFIEANHARDMNARLSIVEVEPDEDSC